MSLVLIIGCGSGQGQYNERPQVQQGANVPQKPRAQRPRGRLQKIAEEGSIRMYKIKVDNVEYIITTYREQQFDVQRHREL